MRYTKEQVLEFAKISFADRKFSTASFAQIFFAVGKLVGLSDPRNFYFIEKIIIGTSDGSQKAFADYPRFTVYNSVMEGGSRICFTPKGVYDGAGDPLVVSEVFDCDLFSDQISFAGDGVSACYVNLWTLTP